METKLKIRVYSDIHLDHYDSFASLWRPPVLPDDAQTTLIIAGDLWVGTRFIQYANSSWIGEMAERFKQVLVVLGNHDYWPASHHLNIFDGGIKCNAMLQDMGLHNVHVLDCDNFVDGDFMFVGATLWTDMNKSDPFTMYNMNNVMRYDGKCAYSTGLNGAWERYTSHKWVQTHDRHAKYIELMAKQNPDKKIVVITHHIPLETLTDPNYKGDWQNAYYTSDLSDLILDNANIKYWFYGHTHYQNDTHMVHCRLINNCVGYKSQQMEGRGLVKHEVIEL